MGGTVFAFRRLRRWALSPRHFVSGRQILTCRLYIYFGSVPSGLTIEIYIFLCGMRSCRGRLLVCFLLVTPSRNVL